MAKKVTKTDPILKTVNEKVVKKTTDQKQVLITKNSSILANDPIIQKVTNNAISKDKALDVNLNSVPLTNYVSDEEKNAKTVKDINKRRPFVPAITENLAATELIKEYIVDVKNAELKSIEVSSASIGVFTSGSIGYVDINQYTKLTNRQNKNFNRTHDFFSVNVNHNILQEKVEKIEDDVNYIKMLDSQIKEHENKILDILDDDINLLLVKYRGENGIPTDNVTFNTLSNIYMNIESGDDRTVSDKNINVFNAPQTSYFAPYTVNFDGTVVPTGSPDYSSKISFISSYDQTFATSFTNDEFYGNVNYYWGEGYSKDNQFVKLNNLYKPTFNSTYEFYSLPNKSSSMWMRFNCIVLKDKNSLAFNKKTRTSGVDLYFCTDLRRFSFNENDFESLNENTLDNLKYYLKNTNANNQPAFYIFDRTDRENSPILFKLPTTQTRFKWSFNLSKGLFDLILPKIDNYDSYDASVLNTFKSLFGSSVYLKEFSDADKQYYALYLTKYLNNLINKFEYNGTPEEIPGFIVQFKYANNSNFEDDLFLKFNLMPYSATGVLTERTEKTKDDYPLGFYTLNLKTETGYDTDIFSICNNDILNANKKSVKYKLSDDRKITYVLPYGYDDGAPESLILSYYDNTFSGFLTNMVTPVLNYDKYLAPDTEVNYTFSENKNYILDDKKETNISKNHDVTDTVITLNKQYLFLEYENSYCLPNYIDIQFTGPKEKEEEEEISVLNESTEVSEETTETDGQTYTNVLSDKCIESIKFNNYDSFETYAFGSLEIVLNTRNFTSKFVNVDIPNTVFNIPIKIFIYSGLESEICTEIAANLPISNIYLSNEHLFTQLKVVATFENDERIEYENPLTFSNYDTLNDIATFSNQDNSISVSFEGTKLLNMDFDNDKFENTILNETGLFVIQQTKTSTSEIAVISEDEQTEQTINVKQVIDKLSNAFYKIKNIDPRPLGIPEFEIRLYKNNKQINLKNKPKIKHNKANNVGWLHSVSEKTDTLIRPIRKGNTVAKDFKYQYVKIFKDDKSSIFNTNDLELEISGIADYTLNLIFDIEKTKVINSEKLEINENFNHFVINSLTGHIGEIPIYYEYENDSIIVRHVNSDYSIKFTFKNETYDLLDENYLVYGNSINPKQTIVDEDNEEKATFFTQEIVKGSDGTNKIEYHANININFENDQRIVDFKMPFLKMFNRDNTLAMQCSVNDDKGVQIIYDLTNFTEFYNFISKYYLSSLSKITFGVLRPETTAFTNYILHFKRNSRGLNIETVNYLKNLNIGSLSDFGELKHNKSDKFNAEITKMFNNLYSNKFFYNRKNNLLNIETGLNLSNNVNVYNDEYVGVETNYGIKSFSYYTNFNNDSIWESYSDVNKATCHTTHEILFPNSMKYLGTVLEPIFFKLLKETIYSHKSFIEELKLNDVLDKYNENSFSYSSTENDFLNTIYFSDFNLLPDIIAKYYDFINTTDPDADYSIGGGITLGGNEKISKPYSLIEFWENNKENLLGIFNSNLDEYNYYTDNVLQFYDYDETLLKEDLVLYSEYMFKKFEPLFPNNELHMDILEMFLKNINPDNNVACRKNVLNRLANEFFKDSSESNFPEMNAYIFDVCYNHGMFNNPPIIDESTKYDIVNNNKTSIITDDKGVDGLTTFKYLYDEFGHQVGIRKQVFKQNQLENDYYDDLMTYKYYVGSFPVLSYNDKSELGTYNTYIQMVGKEPEIYEHATIAYSYYSALKITQTGNVIPFKYYINDIKNGVYDELYSTYNTTISEQFLVDNVTGYSLNNRDKKYDINEFTFVDEDNTTYTASYIFYTGKQPSMILDKENKDICLGYNAFVINQYGNIKSEQFLFSDLLTAANNIKYFTFGQYRFEDKEITNPIQYIKYPSGTNVYTYNFEDEKYFINSYEYIDQNGLSAYASYLYKVEESLSLTDTIETHKSFINLHKLNLEKNANLIKVLKNVQDVLSIKNDTNSISYELINCYTNSTVLRNTDEFVNVKLEFTYTDLINDETAPIQTEEVTFVLPKNTYIYTDFKNAYNVWEGSIYEDKTIDSTPLWTGQMSYTYEISNAEEKNYAFAYSYFIDYLWKDRELTFECILPVTSESPNKTKISIQKTPKDITYHPITSKEYSYVWIESECSYTYMEMGEVKQGTPLVNKFGIANKNAACGMVPWSYVGNADILSISNLPAFSTVSKYIHYDFNGFENTRELLSKLKNHEIGDVPAAREAKNYLMDKQINIKNQPLEFYLGSVSEWQTIEDNIDEINANLSNLDNAYLLYDGKIENDKPENKYFWTSTEVDANTAWTTSLTNYSLNSENKNVSRYVRPLFKENTKYDGTSFYALTGLFKDEIYPDTFVSNPEDCLKEIDITALPEYLQKYIDAHDITTYNLTEEDITLLSELNSLNEMHVLTKLYIKENNRIISGIKSNDTDALLETLDAYSYVKFDFISTLYDYSSTYTENIDRLYLEFNDEQFGRLSDTSSYSTYLLQYFVLKPNAIISQDSTYQTIVKNNLTIGDAKVYEINSQLLKKQIFNSNMSLLGNEKIYSFYSSTTDAINNGNVKINRYGSYYDSYVDLKTFNLTTTYLKTKYNNYLQKEILK